MYMIVHLYIVGGVIAEEVFEWVQELKGLHSGDAAVNQTKEWSAQGLQ